MSGAAQSGTDAFAAAQLALATAEIEQLLADREAAWNWVAGLHALERIERACEASARATARAAVGHPGRWTAAQRAVAAAWRTMAVLRRLQTDAATVRAASHATLALACAGLGEGPGLPAKDAAAPALARMLARRQGEADDFPRHRVRVCAILHALARAASDQERAVGVRPLFAWVHELERWRQPAGGAAPRTEAAVQQWALDEAGERLDARWARAVVATEP